MASINKVILIGNLGKDPELRYMQNGDPVCSATLATSEQWKDKETGEQKEQTEWHRLVFYRRLAEIAGEYLKKGASIYVEGQLRTRKWQDSSGADRYTTEIRVDKMQMLGGRQQAAGSQGAGEPAAARGAAPARSSGFDDMDDDIPF